jgi:uncharacterized protein YcfJ
MKTLNKALIGLLVGSISLTACAGQYNNKPHSTNRHSTHVFYDFVPVQAVTPVYGRVEQRIPTQYCSPQTNYSTSHYSSPRNSATSTIIGGLIGGAIGNNLGHNKSNKRVGAAAGAILGAAIASDLNHSQSYNSYNNNRCSTRYESRYTQEVIAYNVSYQYRGQVYHTRTQQHPGNRIKVKLQFEPQFY